VPRASCRASLLLSHGHEGAVAQLLLEHRDRDEGDDTLHHVTRPDGRHHGGTVVG